MIDHNSLPTVSPGELSVHELPNPNYIENSLLVPHSPLGSRTVPMEVSVLLLTPCNPLPTHTTSWVSTAREWLVLSGQLVTQIAMLSYEVEVVDPTSRTYPSSHHREQVLIYRSEHVQKALADMKKKNPGHFASIMVDCSHGNSSKNHLNQPKVAADVAAQIAGGEEGITGIM